MEYQKSNAAYDLSAFMPAQEPEEPARPKSAKARGSRSAARKSRVSAAAVAKYVFVSLFVMLALASTMVGNIKITQLSDEISSTGKQLSQAQSDQVSLSAKLESRLSMQKVADYAAEKLGLVKIQAYQVEYVHLVDQDKVVVAGHNGVLDDIRNAFASILEFFN